MLTRFISHLRSAHQSPTHALSIIKSRSIRPSRLFRPGMDCLEDRTVPAVIDVTGVGALGISSDGMVSVRHVDMNPTGSGVMNPFLRIHHKDSEQGYNTSYRTQGNDPHLLDDISNLTFTHDIKLSDVLKVTIDGVDYRVFRLDLGEPGNDTSDSGLVNFSRLQFFTSANAEEHVTNNGDAHSYVWDNTLGGATLRYDLDAAGDDDFTLRDLTSGNGALDYEVFVKDSVFAGAGANDYLYLYSQFGSPPPTADGTFEEWSYVPSPTAPMTGSISGHKFEDMDSSNATTNDRTTGFGGFTIFVDIDGDGINNDGFSTVTSADGSYSITGIPAGTYTVYEVTQSGYTAVSSTSRSETVVAGANTANVDFANFKNIVISGYKFYDANTNGNFDGVANGEGKIPNWSITLYNDVNSDGELDGGDTIAQTTTTNSAGNYTFTITSAGKFLVAESTTPPADFTQSGWVPTKDIVQATDSLFSGGTGSATFGNVEIGKGTGLTLGFWSNKNGKAAMTNGPGGMNGALAYLSGLNLRNANGTDFNPTTYDQFRSWILGATATNMANMLSAQMAAMQLNVRQGLVNGSSLIYAPGTMSANINGFASVAAVLAEANTELGLHGLVLSGSPYRSYQESLKNALDNANNNLTFVLLWHDNNSNGVVDPGEIY